MQEQGLTLWEEGCLNNNNNTIQELNRINRINKTNNSINNSSRTTPIKHRTSNHPIMEVTKEVAEMHLHHLISSHERTMNYIIKLLSLINLCLSYYFLYFLIHSI
jgi:hypothetical protein